MIRFFQPRATEAQLLLQGHGGATSGAQGTRRRPLEVALPIISETAPAPSSYRLRYKTEYGEILSITTLTRFPICSRSLIFI